MDGGGGGKCIGKEILVTRERKVYRKVKCIAYRKEKCKFRKLCRKIKCIGKES